MEFPICDLHCDLLSYLAFKEGREPTHREVPCSAPHLVEGKVAFQTLAIFTESEKGSSEAGWKQVEAFKKLISPFFSFKNRSIVAGCGIGIMASFENASSFAEEDEDIGKVLERLEGYLQEIPLLYISLTWNTENRFGGGNFSKIGLKKDGEILLEFLSGKGIAIDFSHASDLLAEDVLEFIDKKNLQIKVIASHSNFRALLDHPRNLPDSIAIEIIRRKGIIGINLFRHFVGEPFSENLVKMVKHALLLGGENALCFGADFFYAEDFKTSLTYPLPFFSPEFNTSACYPKIVSLFQNHFPPHIVEKIAYKNFAAFL